MLPLFVKKTCANCVCCNANDTDNRVRCNVARTTSKISIDGRGDGDGTQIVSYGHTSLNPNAYNYREDGNAALVCIFLAQCDRGLVTTDELHRAMDEALARGWTPAKTPENAPLGVAPEWVSPSSTRPYLSVHNSRLTERVRFPRAGLVTPFSGGSGNTPGRHHDRSARSSLDWDRLDSGNARQAASQEARSRS